jgi:drug/metabolite transporter (DMT)-like permease
VHLLALGLAVLAAASNALSSVMQRKANRRRSGESFGLHLLLSVIRQPAWLIGGVAMLASFLLQAGALSIGTLSAVEPMLVLELPMTLILGAAVLGHRLRGRDWLSVVAMTGGLALFVVVLAPTGGDAARVPQTRALLASGGTVLGIVGLVAFAVLGPPRSRAALYGVAAGSGFGLTASLIKVSVARLDKSGVAALFGAWETYGFAVCGVASVVLIQAALHAGTLVAAQPGITLFDPLVSLLWGTVVLGERLSNGAAVVVLAVVGAALIAASVVVLAHSSQLAVEGAAT